MRFVTFEYVADRLRGKRVAVVGSAPSVLENEPRYIESFDFIIRVNNYKTGPRQGRRTDIHYSFYGASIRKSAEELRSDGVTLCMCKCPDAMPVHSEWHLKTGRMNGVDFRYIYRRRKMFWFCNTYVPTTESFLEKFFLLKRHIPTTGFAALHDVLLCDPRQVYLTGFDFFRSRMHNVDEPWPVREQETADPIRHLPEMELEWLRANMDNYPISFDPTLARIVREDPLMLEEKVAV